mmetsp:Transcript_22404/g.33394  ORF Transcript_22404/g.33394 Transcript_22404/m.33394 type:complete len:95 (+) Transcript_22404:1853-2137(+)
MPLTQLFFSLTELSAGLQATGLAHIFQIFFFQKQRENKYVSYGLRSLTSMLDVLKQLQAVREAKEKHMRKQTMGTHDEHRMTLQDSSDTKGDSS